MTGWFKPGRVVDKSHASNPRESPSHEGLIQAATAMNFSALQGPNYQMKVRHVSLSFNFQAMNELLDA
ncbi:hypothetical protein E4U56_003736 [Claviceps arundinis]|uniref:Uncharacterized protein n=1 Tax=Claviceps arundinis TaxID=1623583 RepID=A0A9P7MNL5_9HYPO|nr:hypothetical protein E4U56_003736 [Claviceps arundinis]